MSGRRVVVVGGGLAGIAAALECADTGAEVTLLESRRWLGGATFSMQRHGLVIDNGQHVFLRCCTAYIALLRRLGVLGLTAMQPRLHIPVLLPGGRRSTLAAARRLPPPLHLAPSFLTYAPLTAPERLRLARAVLPMRGLDPSDPRLDGITLGQWLARRGQSAAAVEAVWNLIALPTLNLPAAQASLAAAITVFRTGLLEDARAADIGVAAVPLSALHSEPALRELRRAGVEVVLGARVDEIHRDGGLRVAFSCGEAQADAVVLAVPHARAGALVRRAGAGRQPYETGLGASPIVNIHVILDRPVLDEPLAASLGSPLQWLFDRTRPSGLSAGQCLAISISAADGLLHRRRSEIAGMAVSELRRLVPRARWARVEHVIVHREPRATFRAVPGTGRLRPGARTELDGLFLAGAWTQTGWPATMEGAVRSGLTAARAALFRLDRGAQRILSEAA